MTAAKQRSQYWDNLKGLFIFLTVFAHILYQLQYYNNVINGIVDFIYMFHMPAFVFISGYFGKSERSRSAPAIIRLIFLYFIFNSTMGFLYGFSSLLEPLYSYWYLPALIIWRLTAHRLAKFREINLILFVVALFAGFYGSINNIFAAARIIAFYPYYMIGYQLTSEQNGTLLQTTYGKRLLKGTAALAAAGTIAFFAYGFFDYSDSALLMYSYGEPAAAFGRIVLYIIAFLMIYACRSICIDRKLPFFTMCGRNSLWILLLHRPFTLWLSDLLWNRSTAVIIACSAGSAVILCLLFGNDFAAKYLNRFADSGAAIFSDRPTPKFTVAKLAAALVSAGFIVSVVAEAYGDVKLEDLKNLLAGKPISTDEEPDEENEDVIYPVMTAAQQTAFDNAFRITFAGDLILLEDQVKRAYTGNGYDFAPVFEYAEAYISSADYAIGVFEGPMAGEEAGYTTGNFDDGKELALNFPDSFAAAVQDAGFDLVTTANNHVLDKDSEGALRTLDILDQIGLDHTGSYRNESEKQAQRVKLVERDGIRMAILSYTYGSNGYSRSELIGSGAFAYLTSVIGYTEGEQFESMKAAVEQDFADAKQLDPDLIIVLPHIGTQFSNEPDAEQQVWFDIFKACGADIILGDHPHVVEPALLETEGGRSIFTAYCPGNFANLYRDKQGDTSMLIDVYIDRATKQVIGGSIVPLYTQAAVDGNYRALPVYEIVNDPALRKQLSTDDYARAQDANDIITDVVFGTQIDIASMTPRYYFDETGFLRAKTGGLTLTDGMKGGVLYKALAEADSVCFLGDSLTEGTKNGGCPWYEPIEEHLGTKKVFNFSKGGCTVSYINQNVGDIPIADLYVIAVGTNDVRYHNPSQCAMTAEEYVEAMDQLKTSLREKNASAQFVMIAPWYSTDGDPYCSMTFQAKTELNEEYSAALQTYCAENQIGFINANPYIRAMLEITPDSVFLLDHIHPNAGKGVIMYSEAVLSCG